MPRALLPPSHCAAYARVRARAHPNLVRRLDAARERGTQFHESAERLATGHAAPDAEEKLRGLITRMDHLGYELWRGEVPVFRKKGDKRPVGKVDLVFRHRLTGGFRLVEVKTGSVQLSLRLSGQRAQRKKGKGVARERMMRAVLAAHVRQICEYVRLWRGTRGEVDGAALYYADTGVYYPLKLR